MGGVQTKGGRPEFYQGSTNTTPLKHRFPFITNWVRIRATSGALRVYFSEAEAALGDNGQYFLVSQATTNEDVFAGPLELEAIWIRGNVGSVTYEIVSTQKRG